jgi:hypothetical protein
VTREEHPRFVYTCFPPAGPMASAHALMAPAHATSLTPAGGVRGGMGGCHEGVGGGHGGGRCRGGGLRAAGVATGGGADLLDMAMRGEIE